MAYVQQQMGSSTTYLFTRLQKTFSSVVSVISDEIIFYLVLEISVVSVVTVEVIFLCAVCSL